MIDGRGYLWEGQRQANKTKKGKHSEMNGVREEVTVLDALGLQLF